MTTVHHPPLRGIGAQHDPSWLWIGLSVLMVGLIAAAISWTASDPTVTETATVDAVITAELAEEATAAHFASPGVTTQYFGASGVPEADWVRELAVNNAIALNLFNGMELTHDTTTMQLAEAGVTTPYFGANGVPEADWVRELAVSNAIALNLFNGMELDHEVTAIHFAEPGVTVLYFGDSGEPPPDK
jgi:hypothetical protein